MFFQNLELIRILQSYERSLILLSMLLTRRLRRCSKSKIFFHSLLKHNIDTLHLQQCHNKYTSFAFFKSFKLITDTGDNQANCRLCLILAISTRSCTSLLASSFASPKKSLLRTASFISLSTFF